MPPSLLSNLKECRRRRQRLPMTTKYRDTQTVGNGDILLRDLIIPDFRSHGVQVPTPGSVRAADTHVPWEFVLDVARLNREERKNQKQK